jgi:hypothetical protein
MDSITKDCVYYNGRMVPREGFRAFVYCTDGKVKVTNSWIEYEAHISTGVWFPSKDEIPKLDCDEEKSKSKRKGGD